MLAVRAHMGLLSREWLAGRALGKGAAGVGRGRVDGGPVLAGVGFQALSAVLRTRSAVMR